MLHVALINPEIPWNAGNIGRTCVAAGATLHFVGKLGFKITSKEIRRSGLDYWPVLDYKIHQDFNSLIEYLPKRPELIFFSTRGKKLFWNAPYSKNCCLIFGNESGGLPHDMYERYADALYSIPVSAKVRSLNLSTAAGIAIYEAMRQSGNCGYKDSPV